MCGRFSLSTDVEKLVRVFEIALVDEPGLFTARYNIAPSQRAPAVVFDASAGGRRLRMLRWGLVPPWAEDLSIGNRMVNARAETVATSKVFGPPFRGGRRCLVLAEGFYEWQRQTGGRKQPYFIRRRDEVPMALAGLWERWQPRGQPGEAEPTPIDTCTIITTQCNDLIRPLHNRMPVVLGPEAWRVWLDPAVRDGEPLRALLRPYASEEMRMYPVSPAVNSPRHDAADCVEPVTGTAEEGRGEEPTLFG